MGHVIELVWDASLAGTATAASGATLSVGERTDWEPDELLAAAAAACLMRTFLRAAEKEPVDILGYVTAGHIVQPGCQVRLRVCIVTEDARAARMAYALCLGALEASPVAQFLGDRLEVDVSARSLGGSAVPGD
jgi:organic hydroperoxide reductase OsmC/OhrA